MHTNLRIPQFVKLGCMKDQQFDDDIAYWNCIFIYLIENCVPKWNKRVKIDSIMVTFHEL